MFGSRFVGDPQRVHYFWHYAGNKLLTLLSDMLTNLKLTDMETRYKVFRREVLQGITLKSDRFGFEPECTAKIAKGNWRVYEVPISYAGRTAKAKRLLGGMAPSRSGMSFATIYSTEFARASGLS